MTYLLHRIVSAKVLPERSKGGYGGYGVLSGGYGVLFEFSDGWVEACFHMTKEEAERQTRRIGESVPVPTYAGRLKPGMSR
jgi:hypothetical protein